jgi:hypothetical protein
MEPTGDPSGRYVRLIVPPKVDAATIQQCAGPGRVRSQPVETHCHPACTPCQRDHTQHENAPSGPVTPDARFGRGRCLLHPNDRTTYSHLTSPNSVTERSPSVSWSILDTATRQLRREPADRHGEVVPGLVGVEAAVALAVKKNYPLKDAVSSRKCRRNRSSLPVTRCSLVSEAGQVNPEHIPDRSCALLRREAAPAGGVHGGAWSGRRLRTGSACGRMEPTRGPSARYPATIANSAQC